MATIPIAEAIQAIRREIVAAVSQGEGEDIKFDLGDIELEFQVQFSQQKGEEGNMKGSFKGSLKDGVLPIIAGVSVEASGEFSGKQSEQKSKGTTHRVKLTLKPKRGDGSSLDVAGQGVTELPG